MSGGRRQAEAGRSVHRLRAVDGRSNHGEAVPSLSAPPRSCPLPLGGEEE